MVAAKHVAFPSLTACLKRSRFVLVGPISVVATCRQARHTILLLLAPRSQISERHRFAHVGF